MRRFPGSWSTTLSKLGLKLVRRQPSKRRVRGVGYGRRSSIESLECRQLLTGSPWAGSDVVIGDFDGDGNLDRLGNMAVSATDPLVWNVDTKASSAAGTAESWRLSSPASLPQLNEFLVGDFNADGRDDILSRAGSGAWTMIQSRSTAQSGYSGEFAVYTSWGLFDAVGGWSTPIVGDFNGDGRDDLAAFNDSNPADKQWQVRISTGTSWELVAAWATQTSIAPAAGSIVAGDFNGDGRDELLFKKLDTQNWAIAVSDGTRFNVFDPTPIATTPWTAGHIGDFDGDGADELLGWNSTGTPHWETVRYTDHRGMSVDTSWGNHLSAIVTGSNLHIGDANRDGRDDLIVYNTGASAWTVALSQQTAAGTNAFTYTAPQSDGTNNWGRWFKDWDWGPTDRPFLNIDAPYQKFLDIFSDVYNNVELELYPGLMKGIEATAQTRAGNDWDQAALLVDRLEDDGFEDANIAYGTVTVGWAAAALWSGATSNTAAFNAIAGSLDGYASQPTAETIRFKHAWVRALAPVANGLTMIDVDPSWKFKDRQQGEAINLTNVNFGYAPITGRSGRGTFDEFGYLQNAGPNQLPIEWYEDQVMSYLALQNKNKSLADTWYDGPIIKQNLSKISAGLGADVTIDGVVETFANLAYVLSSTTLKDRFVHQATVAIEREIDSSKRSNDVTLPDSYQTLNEDDPLGAKYIDVTALPKYSYDMFPGHTYSNFQPQTIELSMFERDFNPVGKGTLFDLRGTEQYFAVPIPGGYQVTEYTAVRLDFVGYLGSIYPPQRFYIGFDTNLAYETGGRNARIEFGNLDASSGATTLDDRFDYNGTPGIAQYLIFGGQYTNYLRFANVVLYEDRDFDTQAAANSNGYEGRHIFQTQTNYASLNFADPGYEVTPNTVMEVEFKPGTLGRLHAIGWDVDSFSGNDSVQPSAMYKLAGTSSTFSGYSTNYSVTPAYDGYNKYTIPIGSSIGTGASAVLRRLRFHSDNLPDGVYGVGSYFRNITFRESDLGVGGEHWSQTLSMPEISLSTINIDYLKTENSPATTLDDTYRSRLLVSGNVVQEGTSSEIFQTGDNAKIRIQHLSPSEFGIAPSADIASKSYTREPGQILAIGFDANQYSTDHIVGLQSGLNAALSDGAAAADIGQLLSYTSAKYWYEFNRNNRTIDRLLRTVGGKQWVGSGIVTSDPYLLTDSIPGLNGGTPIYTSEDLKHLQFPILPHNMGVDLPNTNHISFDIEAGTRNDEAFQLFGYNASALENAILEEVVSSPSVSTIRGLENAFDSSSATVWVYESVWEAGQRKIYQRGSIAQSSGATTYAPTGGVVQLSAQVAAALTSGSVPHSVEIADSVVAILENRENKYGGANGQAPIRVLVPKVKSEVGTWSGSVYVAEYRSQTGGRRGGYVIAPDGGTPTNGGYIGNVRKPENSILPLSTFLNQTFAGDPINVANGNMFRDDVDFQFANPIVPLDFSRHYDSQNKLDVGFGVGWVHGFTGLVYEEQDPANSGDVDYVWLRGSGERHTFEDLNFTLPNTLFGDIETNGGPANDKRLTAFKDRSGTQYIFEPIADPNSFVDVGTNKKIFSRLIAIKDATGNQGVTITYDDVANLKSVRVKEVHSLSTPSRYLQFVYSGTNIEVKRYDAGQLMATWAYALATNLNYTGKRLTQVKHADQTSVTTTTNYLYYDDGPASRRGLIKKITEPNGELHSYEYYANGRVFRVTDGAGNQQSFNYNLFRNLTEFTDENGNVETYIHQDNGLLTKQIHDDRSRLEYTWGPQSANNTVQREEFLMQSSTDERGAKEEFTYYNFDPNSSSSRPGELQTSKSKDGVVSTYAYKSHAFISSVTSVTQTPPNGASPPITEYTYDDLGHILTAKDAAGHITKYEYYDSAAPAHLRGLRKSETLPKGVSTQQLAAGETYEAVPWQVLSSAFTIAGDTISVQLRTPAPGQYVVADAIRIDRLDKNGVYTRIIDSTTTANDPKFRLGTGGGTTLTDGSDAYGGSYVQITGTSPEQVGATWIFSNLEPGTYRISASWQFTTSNSAAAKYSMFQGLPDGAPEATISGINQTVVPASFRSYQTLFEYDTAGNLTRSITEGLPSGRRAYDSFGNVVYDEDATGVATVYSYDALGRLSSSMILPSKQSMSLDKSSVVQSYHGGVSLDVDRESWEVLDGGSKLHLYGNTRKAISIGNYQVSQNTKLEFDFEAPVAGEWYGISIGTSLSTIHPAGAAFKLYGSDPTTYGWNTSLNGQYIIGSGPKHYTIDLGAVALQNGLTGSYGYLIFTNADTMAGGVGPGQSYFSNIRLYESTSPLNQTVVHMPIDKSSAVQSYHGGASFDVDRESWEVLDGGSKLHLYGNTRKAVSISSYPVTQTTRLEFDFEAPAAGEWYGISIGNSLSTIHPATTAFKLYGSDPTTYGWNTSLNGQYTIGSGPKHYTIDLGAIVQQSGLTGPYYLIFTNADTMAGGVGPGQSYFSNIRLYESTGENSVGKTSYVYDPSGRVASVTDALSNRTAFEYDTAGRLVKTTFPDRTYTTHSYDNFGNCIATTDELGRTTHYVYDDRNRLIQTIYPDGNSTRVRYDGSGQIVSSFDERGTESRFTYDKAGRLLTTIVAPGSEQAKAVNKYDLRGRRVESVDANGIVTKYMYDDLDRLVQTTVLDKTHTSLNDATETSVVSSRMPMHVSTIAYDSNGNVVRTATFDPMRFDTADYANLLGNTASLITTPNEVDNRVQVVRTIYDAFGRATKTTNADGTSTSTIYDAAGRVRLTFDELGRKTQSDYDQYGRLAKITFPDPDGPGPGKSRYVKYERNKAGDVLYEWENFDPQNDGNNGETANWFNYDTRGLMKRRSDKYDSELTRFVYDVAGQLVSTIDPENNADYSQYDKRGRVVRERAADPDGAGPQFAPVTTRTYDADGNIETMTDARGSKTTFTYDVFNRLKTEIRYHELLLDDSADTGDVAFTVNTGTRNVQQNEFAVGGDFISIESPTATATWSTGALDAGTYRVAATWLNKIFWATNATANISVYRDGQAVYSTTISNINQTKPPVGVEPIGFEDIDGDVSRVWQILKDGVNVAAGDTISVQLVKSAGSYLLADAIRVDRVSVTEYGYDKNGNLASEKDSRGFTTRHFYDELGRENKTVSADPDGPGTPLFGLVTERVFDGYGNIVTEHQGHQTSASVDTYQKRRSDNFEYDRRNRLTKEILNVNADTGSDDNVTTLYEYDLVGNRTKVTDAEGFETCYRYDAADRQIEVYQQVKKNENSTPLLTLGTPAPVPGYNGTAGRPTSTSINLAGNAWAYSQISTYAATHRTVLEFDLDVANVPERLGIGFDTDVSRTGTTAENNRLFDLGGTLQSLGDFVRDFRNLRLGEGHAHVQIPIGQYLTPGEKLSGISISHLVFANLDGRSGLSNDDLGQSVFSNLRFFESDEVRTVTTYDTHGNVETVREASDPRNITTRYVYDRLGRLDKQRINDGDSQQQVLDYQYDNASNLIKAITYHPNDEARETLYEYDRLGRRTKKTLPDADGSTATPNGLVTTFTYDVVGNLIAETKDATIPGQATKLITTQYFHDEQGHVISEIDGNGDETHYRYDSEGNLTAVIDAEQNVTRYEYDGLNRVTKETIKATVNGTPSDLNRVYVYSAAGNLERIFDRNNRHIHLLYDGLDRKITEYWRPTAYVYGETPIHVNSWAYDKLSRVTKQVDGSSNYGSAADDLVDTYAYDGLGRVIEERNYDPTTISSQGQSSGLPRLRQEFSYSFQLQFNGPNLAERVDRTQILVSSGVDIPVAVTKSEYDRLGRLVTSKDVDASTLAGPSVEQKSLVFSYEAGTDNLATIQHLGNYNSQTNTWQNSLTSYLNYDKANRIRNIIHNLPTQIIHEFAYNNASRIIGFNTSGTGAANRAYQYDNAGQLTSKTGLPTSETYSYDDNGNRVTAGGQSVVTGLANRVTSDGTYSYEYDEEGNVTSKTLSLDPGQRTYYTWDHRNRLTKVSAWNGDHEDLIVDYKYDASDRLVSKSTNRPFETGLETEYFVYDSNGVGDDELAMSFTKSGSTAATLEHRYFHGPGGQTLVDEVFNASGQSTDTLWLLGDHQGTPRDIVDDNGVLRKHTNFDSFGRITGEQLYDRSGAYLLLPQGHPEAVDEAFAFTGEFRDKDTGLQLHGQRWYDPGTGRWLSEDPLGLGPDSNLYRYVHNNPVIYVDPTGLYQQGNPLNNLNLYAGGYSGGTVASPTFVNPYVGSTSLFASPTYNPYASSLANLSTPIITQPMSSAGLSVGTLGTAVGNAAVSYVGPITRSALGAGASLAGASVAAISGSEDSEGFFGTVLRYIASPRVSLTEFRRGAELDRQLDGIRLRDAQQKLAIDSIRGEAQLNALQQLQTARAVGDAKFLAEGAVQFNAAALSGGFLRPGELGVGGGTESGTQSAVGQSQRMSRGALFNRVRANKFAHNEVYVENGAGGYNILDSYNPGTDIVSRKFTQLSEVSDSTAKSYIQEAARKYSVGTKIANVKSSGSLAGQELKGQLYLEVPIQAKSIPKTVLDDATRYGIKIRDVNGKVHNP